VGSGVYGSGFRAEGFARKRPVNRGGQRALHRRAGSGVKGAGCRMWGVRCRVEGGGWRVEGFGLKDRISTRCKNPGHIRQSRPDSGLDFQVNVRTPFQYVPCSLGRGLLVGTVVNVRSKGVGCRVYVVECRV